MAANDTKKFVSLTDTDVQNYLEAEKNLKYEKKNRKLHGFGASICRGWAKISKRKISQRSILAV